MNLATNTTIVPLTQTQIKEIAPAMVLQGWAFLIYVIATLVITIGFLVYFAIKLWKANDIKTIIKSVIVIAIASMLINLEVIPDIFIIPNLGIGVEAGIVSNSLLMLIANVIIFVNGYLAQAVTFLGLAVIILKFTKDAVKAISKRLDIH